MIFKIWLCIYSWVLRRRHNLVDLNLRASTCFEPLRLQSIIVARKIAYLIEILEKFLHLCVANHNGGSPPDASLVWDADVNAIKKNQVGNNNMDEYIQTNNRLDIEVSVLTDGIKNLHSASMLSCELAHCQQMASASNSHCKASSSHALRREQGLPMLRLLKKAFWLWLFAAVQAAYHSQSQCQMVCLSYMLELEACLLKDAISLIRALQIVVSAAVSSLLANTNDHRLNCLDGMQPTFYFRIFWQRSAIFCRWYSGEIWG